MKFKDPSKFDLKGKYKELRELVDLDFDTYLWDQEQLDEAVQALARGDSRGALVEYTQNEQIAMQHIEDVSESLERGIQKQS